MTTYQNNRGEKWLLVPIDENGNAIMGRMVYDHEAMTDTFEPTNKIPAHPSLIEWMQREGKEVVSDKEFEVRSLAIKAHDDCVVAGVEYRVVQVEKGVYIIDPDAFGHRSGIDKRYMSDLVAYPLPQTEDDKAFALTRKLAEQGMGKKLSDLEVRAYTSGYVNCLKEHKIKITTQTDKK